jgi:hypothetical protein
VCEDVGKLKIIAFVFLSRKLVILGFLGHGAAFTGPFPSILITFTQTKTYEKTLLLFQ